MSKTEDTSLDTVAQVVPGVEMRINSSCWSVSVAETEGRKAEGASKETRCILASGATGDPESQSCR